MREIQKLFFLFWIIFSILLPPQAAHTTSHETTPLWVLNVDSCCSVDISTDGRYIAGLCWEKFFFFNRNDAHPIWNCNVRSGPYKTVLLSADGQYILVKNDDHLLLFNRTESVPIWNYSAGVQIRSVGFSGDGQKIVAGYSENGDLVLFKQTNPITLLNYSNLYFNADISADGQFVVASSPDDVFYLFNTSGPTLKWTFIADDNIEEVAISADGQYLAAGGIVSDCNVYFFNRTNSIPLWNYTVGGYVERLVMSADGNYLVAGTWPENKLYLFHRNSSTPLWTYACDNYIECIDISADGHYFVVGVYENSLLLFNVSNNIPLWNYSTYISIEDIAISGDGQHIVVGDFYRIYLFNREGTGPSEEQPISGFGLLLCFIAIVLINFRRKAVRNIVKKRKII